VDCRAPKAAAVAARQAKLAEHAGIIGHQRDQLQPEQGQQTAIAKIAKIK